LEKIRAAIADGVRTVTLARADKRNALDADMLDALTATFRRTPDKDERLTVVRADGTVFCSGLDLRVRGAGTVGAASIETMLHALENYPLPVVAVVQGDAIAGGNELALHCDFVVAAETARFGMFLAKKIVEIAGPVGAREILLLGDLLTAARMHDLGLIARVAPPEKLEAAAQRIIGRLAANAPLSLRAMKALLVRAMTFRDALPHADVDALVRAASESGDAREGIAALLEKRPARFTGR
jgi:enoyl-CoA hydratase/carnithine racemase